MDREDLNVLKTTSIFSRGGSITGKWNWEAIFKKTTTLNNDDNVCAYYNS
jgi:hypothetical protein